MHLRQEVNPTSTNAKLIPEHCVVIYDLPFYRRFYKDDRNFHLLLHPFPIKNAKIKSLYPKVNAFVQLRKLRSSQKNPRLENGFLYWQKQWSLQDLVYFQYM